MEKKKGTVAALQKKTDLHFPFVQQKLTRNMGENIIFSLFQYSSTPLLLLPVSPVLLWLLKMQLFGHEGWDVNVFLASKGGHTRIWEPLVRDSHTAPLRFTGGIRGTCRDLLNNLTLASYTNINPVNWGQQFDEHETVRTLNESLLWERWKA